MTAAEIKFKGHIRGTNIVGNIREIDFTFGKVLMTFKADDGTRTCRYNLSEIELLQFTGEMDVKGNEIFKGDNCRLLKDGKPIGVIETIEFKHGAFWLRHRDYPMSSWLNYMALDGEEFNGEFEVIGNIYENPELLNSNPQP